MGKSLRLAAAALSILALAGAGVIAYHQIQKGETGSTTQASESTGGSILPSGVLGSGKKIAFDRKKGNCLACHIMDDGEQPGNVGPPLVYMKARYPDKALLRQQISDARIKNSNTIMPPFGAHGILTEEEVDQITDYVYGL